MKRAAALGLVAAAVALVVTMSLKQKATPPPPPAAGTAPALASVVPKPNSVHDVTKEDESFDPCSAPNAQEIWYRMKNLSSKAQIYSRRILFSGATRWLVLSQIRTDDKIRVTGNWRDKSSSLETPPVELLMTNRFMSREELFKLAGPSWIGEINALASPDLVEEEYRLGPDQPVLIQNGIATLLRADLPTAGGIRRVECGEKSLCYCP
jgi:hypothetical protein